MAPRPSEGIMTSASTRSGGEAVVRSLIANGIDTIFGLPGVQLDHFFNALHDHGNELRVLNARHEQGTAYMAFGWAQSTGRIGAYAVVPGPGLLNTGAALATTYGCGAKVPPLTGQIPAHPPARRPAPLHQH